MRNQIQYKKGITLIESIVYFSLLAILVSVVMTSLISLFKSYSYVQAEQDIEATAIQVFDKLTRDIKNANSVVTASSSFNVPQGAVAVTIASTTASVVETYRYYWNNYTVQISRDSTQLGMLSSKTVTVGSFTARHINGTSTQAIKFEMNLTITPHFGTTTISKNFYTTIQLRD